MQLTILFEKNKIFEVLDDLINTKNNDIYN